MNVLPIAFEGNFLIPIIPLLIPIIVMFVGGIVAVVAIYFHFRKQQLWHDTARIAIEKGQPVPPMTSENTPIPPTTGTPAEWEEVKRRQTVNGLMIGGLVNLGIGIGLFLLLSHVLSNRNLGYIGAIPGFIGAALLVAAFLMLKTAPQSTK